MGDETTATPSGEEPLRALPDLDLPDDHIEAVPFLLERLVEEREATAARVDDLQRIAAEFENFRKRTERERDDLRERASQRLVEALLPVLDSFDLALAHPAQTPGEQQLATGMSGTFTQLWEVLAREGLEAIDAAGHPFDPAVHEAVSGGIGDDLVVATELRRGYTLRGRVLRPTMVVVAPTDAGEGAGE